MRKSAAWRYFAPLQPCYAFFHTGMQHGYHCNKYLALRHLFDFCELAEKHSTKVD
ncbi:MAG: hypothetical protein IBX43_05970 [Campylobacterales bacterium]|nr:hypothetical protein [Campylobacterales bacterium]